MFVGLLLCDDTSDLHTYLQVFILLLCSLATTRMYNDNLAIAARLGRRRTSPQLDRKQEKQLRPNIVNRLLNKHRER